MTIQRDVYWASQGSSWLSCPSPQGLCQEAAAADSHEGDSEELRRLPQAAELAVVEALHQGECSRPHVPSRDPLPWVFILDAPDVGQRLLTVGAQLRA